MDPAFFVTNPALRDQKLVELARIHQKADRSNDRARLVTNALIVVLVCGASFGAALLLRSAGPGAPLIAVTVLIGAVVTCTVGFVVTIRRSADLYIQETEAQRDASIRALFDDTWALPRWLFNRFYVADGVSEEDLWSAAQQLNLVSTAEFELAHVEERLNLSADQRHDLQTKRAAIDAVREEVGLLLNPEATDADHGAADVTRAPG